ncbi:hypothetical protein HK099_006412 [Clydaea vesicula]|uniref:Uncharacterized protein n=1 Tax=Clydaea vesicula TaxID=447962 RepID=A0AAD5Y0W4_9FUNG|nr:hypothetical protein HK099_006412 [Clydaea vesicula]
MTVHSKEVFEKADIKKFALKLNSFLKSQNSLTMFGSDLIRISIKNNLIFLTNLSTHNAKNPEIICDILFTISELIFKAKKSKDFADQQISLTQAVSSSIGNLKLSENIDLFPLLPMIQTVITIHPNQFRGLAERLEKFLRERYKSGGKKEELYFHRRTINKALLSIQLTKRGFNQNNILELITGFSASALRSLQNLLSEVEIKNVEEIKSDLKVFELSMNELINCLEWSKKYSCIVYLNDFLKIIEFYSTLTDELRFGKSKTWQLFFPLIGYKVNKLMVLMLERFGPHLIKFSKLICNVCLNSLSHSKRKVMWRLSVLNVLNLTIKCVLQDYRMLLKVSEEIFEDFTLLEDENTEATLENNKLYDAGLHVLLSIVRSSYLNCESLKNLMKKIFQKVTETLIKSHMNIIFYKSSKNATIDQSVIKKNLNLSILKSLYKLLFSLVESLNGGLVLGVSLKLFEMGFQLPNKEINQLCEQYLIQCSAIIHPIRPAGLESFNLFEVNNEIKDQQSFDAFSLLNNPNRNFLSTEKKNYNIYKKDDTEKSKIHFSMTKNSLEVNKILNLEKNDVEAIENSKNVTLKRQFTDFSAEKSCENEIINNETVLEEHQVLEDIPVSKKLKSEEKVTTPPVETVVTEVRNSYDVEVEEDDENFMQSLEINADSGPDVTDDE